MPIESTGLFSGPSSSESFVTFAEVDSFSRKEEKRDDFILEAQIDEDNSHRDLVTLSGITDPVIAPGEEIPESIKPADRSTERDQLEAASSISSAPETENKIEGPFNVQFDPLKIEQRFEDKNNIVVERPPEDLRKVENKERREVIYTQELNKQAAFERNRQLLKDSIDRQRTRKELSTVNEGSSKSIINEANAKPFSEPQNPAVKEDSISAGRRPIVPKKILEPAITRPEPLPLKKLVAEVKKENRALIESRDFQAENIERKRNINKTVDIIQQLKDIEQLDTKARFKTERENDRLSLQEITQTVASEQQVLATKPSLLTKDPLKARLETLSMLGKTTNNQRQIDQFL